MREAWSDGLLESGFGHPQLARVMGWPARIGRMVEVEAALARALGRTGLVSAAAVADIERACEVEQLDLDALAAEAAASATPVIPLVRVLTSRCEGEGAAHLHHGATSQDVIDTAVVLQLRRAVDLLEGDITAAAMRCAELADRHRHDVVAGRTLGQQAAPVTFGLQAARWLSHLDRVLQRLREVRGHIEVVQLGGVVGTLAVYGEHGPAVVAALADELDLAAPDLPWHAERERIVELAGALQSLVGAVGTIATTLVLGARSEVGELSFTPGPEPTSSALPHKRNAVDAVAARAAAHLATGELATLAGLAGHQEHERAAGAWQAEWVALPSAVVRTGGAVARLRAALERLEFDGDRARRNLADQLDLVCAEALSTALTPSLGRPEAQRLTARVAAATTRDGHSLRVAAAADPEVTAVLDDAALERVVDPAASVGNADTLIERALATHRGLLDGEGTP